MAICLWSRLGSRVIRHLGRFDAAYAEDLKRAAASLSWEDWLVPGTSFRVSFQGTDDNIRNSHFGAQCIKDGVLDRMSATGADRPSVEGKDPDLPIHARLHRGKLELGMDLAGASLHRRGYRTDAGEAPLRENLAAALLHRAGWPAIAADNEDFVDPLCGSGTLLIEAAMMATDSAPGLSRSLRSNAGRGTTPRPGSSFAMRQSNAGMQHSGLTEAVFGAAIATERLSGPPGTILSAPG